MYYDISLYIIEMRYSFNNSYNNLYNIILCLFLSTIYDLLYLKLASH